MKLYPIITLRYSQLNAEQKKWLKPLGVVPKDMVFIVLRDGSLGVDALLDPKTAERYASPEVQHPLQRNVNDNHLKEIIQDLTGGSFTWTNDPIAFDRDGRGVNGRHRLIGCASSGVDMPVFLVFGMPPETIAAIDGGTKRALHHVLQMKGSAVPAGAGAARVLETAIRLESLDAASARVSATSLEVAYQERYKAAWETLAGLYSVYRNVFTATAWGAMLAVARYYPDEVYKFAEDICTLKTTSGSAAQAYGTWRSTPIGRATAGLLGIRMQTVVTLRALRLCVTRVKVASVGSGPVYIVSRRGRRTLLPLAQEAEVRWLRELGKSTKEKTKVKKA